jgi:hypothetical protein
LGGCAHEVGFETTYVSHQDPSSTAAGKLLLVMAPSERDFVYAGTADSPRGGDHTLTVPIGAMIAEIATAVLGRCFAEGVVLAEALAGVGGYALAVHPDLAGFVYRYTDSSEPAFSERDDAVATPVLITPEIEVGLTITAYDSARRPVLEKSYESGTVAGESYYTSNAPYDEVNKALHAALHTLMMQAANDINNLVGGACDLHEVAALRPSP